jgi:hypothetical protein
MLNKLSYAVLSLCIFIGCSDLTKKAGNNAVVPRFELAGEGRTVVVLPERAEPSTYLAAEEITNYVFRSTGIKLDVCSDAAAPADASRVVIGTLDTLASVPGDVREKLLSMKQSEAAWTGVVDGKLWIVGREETAELYAAYDFLERELGVRWFQAPVAEDPGDYVPRKDLIMIAPFSRYREPAFPIRRLDHCGAAARPLPVNGMKTAVRNGFQVLPPYGGRVNFGDPADFFARRVSRRMQTLGGGHLTFVNPMPGKETYPEHPEFFALVDGKRVQGGHHMEQYCLSNPEVRRRTAQYILKRLKECDGKGQYVFGQVDTPHGYCRCDNCMALDSEKERAGGGRSRTTRFVKTINDIADQVWEKCPTADLRMWAYLDYRQLPDGVKPDPRFKLYFCPHGRCYGHDLDDDKCVRNVEMFSLLKSWQRFIKDVYVYEYLNCTPHLYSCSEAREAHDIRLYHRMGLIGWKNEASFSDSRFVKPKPYKKDVFPSNWQWLYLTGKMLWNPLLDENAVLEDAESKYYGPAYPAMKEYQALRRKLWNEHPNHMGYPTGDQRRPMLLDRPGSKEKLLELLDKAEALAAGDAVSLFRVRRDRRWFEEYWIKENDAVKARRSKVLTVPLRNGKVTVDGDGSDSAWGGAVYVDSFRTAALGEKGPSVPSALASSAGILYDDENIYFLFEAKEPSPGRMKAVTGDKANVWDDDGFEVFLYPPAIENRCYHLAVNTKGALWGGTHPGSRVAGAFGAQAAAKVHEGRYVIELKVPLKNVAPVRKGEAWRVNIARNRTVGDAVTPGAKPGGAVHYSLDGTAYHDTVSYRSVEFGGAYLKNGAFAELNDKGLPKSWGVPKGGEIEKTARGNMLRLKKGQFAMQTMWHGALKQDVKPRRLKYTVHASGKGSLSVGFIRYNDTRDRKAKHGYRRKQLHPSGIGGTYRLSDGVKEFSGEYEVAANEWCSIMVSASGEEAVVESVSVDPL